MNTPNSRQIYRADTMLPPVERAKRPNHAAAAASLCAISILIVLLAYQWMPAMHVGAGMETVDALSQSDAVTLRVLRF